ncbi:MAG: helix-turn-helix transcriptional regulator [Lachnospiraceae bacterium]|nr:helix-turn-helix transcriptional regulator [Lachnospiraceae bacterium]
MQTIGQRLKEWRKSKGLTITEIANKTGLSTGGLSAYERDEKQIGSKSLLALWSEYQIDIAWILTGKMVKDLTPEERILVDSYRACSTTGRERILQNARDMQQLYPELPEGVSTSATGKTGTAD